MVKFACDGCGRSYGAAEELRGRAFKMKCKSCGHIIVVKPAASPPAKAAAKPATAPVVEVPQVSEPTPRPFSVPASAPMPERADRPSPRTDAGTDGRRCTDSKGTLSDVGSGVTVPVREASSNNGTQLSMTGYLDFMLAEPGGLLPKATELAPESQLEADEDAICEPLEEPPPPPVPARATEPSSKDPFAGWISEGDEPKPTAAAEGEARADTEVTDPVAAPEAAPAIVASPPSSHSEAIPRKGGVLKPLLYGGVATLVVTAVLGVAVLKRGSAVPSPSAPGAPATAGSPAPAVQRIQPELAAPDPQQTTAPAPAAESPAADDRLDSSEVDEVVAAHRKSFKECVAQASRRDPALKKSGKKVTLVVMVAPSGDVASAQLDDPELDEPQLNACLSKAAKRMVFPSFEGGPMFVNVPLSFAR